jgi:hypothetical protein
VCDVSRRAKKKQTLMHCAVMADTAASGALCVAEVLDAVDTVARCGGHEGLVHDADVLFAELDVLDENGVRLHAQHPFMPRIAAVLTEFYGSEFFDPQNEDCLQLAQVCKRARALAGLAASATASATASTTASTSASGTASGTASGAIADAQDAARVVQ